MLLSGLLLACLEATAPLGGSACAQCHSDLPSGAPFVAPGGLAEAPTVGAHAAHLWEPRWSRPAACTDCHAAVGAVDAEGHLDDGGPALPVDVTWASSDLPGGAPYDAAGQTCAVYCHGATLVDGGAVTPSWTDPATTACGSCHAQPPLLVGDGSAEHPQTGAPCTVCHSPATEAWASGDPEQHVDGQVVATGACTDCHGEPGGSPAAADDFHRTHDGGSASSARVACVDCHVVPLGISDPGHTDDLGDDDVVLSGVAALGGRAPRYVAATCAETYCHAGAETPPAYDGAPLPCGGCHGMPPPAPHPDGSSCGGCHPDVSPATHVNGQVDL